MVSPLLCNVLLMLLLCLVSFDVFLPIGHFCFFLAVRTALFLVVLGALWHGLARHQWASLHNTHIE